MNTEKKIIIDYAKHIFFIKKKWAPFYGFADFSLILEWNYD